MNDLHFQWSDNRRSVSVIWRNKPAASVIRFCDNWYLFAGTGFMRFKTAIGALGACYKIAERMERRA